MKKIPFSFTKWDKFKDGEWHFSVTTFDGLNFRHYIDGIEVEQ